MWVVRRPHGGIRQPGILGDEIESHFVIENRDEEILSHVIDKEAQQLMAILESSVDTQKGL